MENKDIILIIFFILILYLLFCDNRKNKEIKELKENFSATTSSTDVTTGVTTTTTLEEQEIRDKVDKYLAERKEIPISESIKNIGIIAKKLQEGHFLNIPGDFVIDGDLNVKGKINTDSNLNVKGKINTDGGIKSNNYIYTKGLSTTDNIWIEKEKRIGWQKEDGSKIGSYIKGRENGQIDINYDSNAYWVNVNRLWAAGNSRFKKGIEVNEGGITSDTGIHTKAHLHANGDIKTNSEFRLLDSDNTYKGGVWKSGNTVYIRSEDGTVYSESDSFKKDNSRRISFSY